MLGVVVSSSSPCVAARCAHVRSGAGAAASQNVTDPRLGPRLLDRLAAGEPAEDAMDVTVSDARFPEYRQLTCVDREGRVAVHSGARTLGLNGHRLGDGCVAAGNLLATLDVLDAMVETFAARAADPLGGRLLAVAEAALAAGGEEGPVRSVGMLVADRESWPMTDLRVDWHDDPIGELGRLWTVWEPQAADYVTRALNPEAAPSYGVPGDR